MIDGLSWVALLLLAIGGLVYSTGTIFYLMRRLKFRPAIWHGHGADTDIIVASVKAYIAALNRMLTAREATATETKTHDGTEAPASPVSTYAGARS